MAVPPTFIVLVTGIAGDSALPGGLGNMHSYLLQHFSDAHQIVFNTVDCSAEDVVITVPDLRDSALNLLQTLDINKAKLEGGRILDVKSHDDGPKKQRRHQLPDIPAPKLVFLCHDIGGFLVKQVLLLANSEPSFEWVTRATAAVLFFETPHTVPTHLSWERLMVRMLAQTESVLDFISFLRYLPNYASQLETEFEGISGTHHLINVLSRESDYAVVTRENMPCPIYSCDQICYLDCDPKQMWNVSDKVSWGDTIRRVISTHLCLHSKDPQEVTRSFSTSLAPLRPGLHQLATPAHRSIPTDFARWATWEEYKDWASGTENHALHIVGRPGTGSSLFATQITSHLRGGGNLVLSYSVCNKLDQRNSTVSLWHSFCQQALLSPSAHRSTAQLCSRLSKEGIFNKETFKGLLRSILSGCAGKAIFCIINGLHHYTAEARDELLRDLGEMRTSSQGEFKVLTVGYALHVREGEPGSPLVVYLQEQILAAGELERLAKTRIRNMAAANPVWKTLDLESEHVKRLWTGRATFFELCQKMDFLEKAKTPSTPDEAIDRVATLPADFTVFFRTLTTKYGFLHDGSLGAAVLPWLIRSVRPMTVSELAVCVALARTSIETLTLQHLQKSISWSLRRDLEDALGPIIRITGETVEMRHCIYQDLVLENSNALCKGDVHLDILTTCVIYLRQIGPWWKHSTEFQREHRLAEYAALHWPEHYHEVRAKATAKPVILSLLQNEEQFTVWLDIYSHYATRSAEEESFPRTPIQVAAYMGLTEVLSELVANLNPSNKDTELTKAMEFAVKKGHANVIPLVAEPGVRTEGALLGASWLDDNATVTELLKTHGTYITSRGGSDGVYTPFPQAARCGHAHSFAKLQCEGADPNLGNKEGRLPISMAVEFKNLDIVTALLDGAPTLDVDQIGMDGLTPLLRACKVARGSVHDVAKFVRELFSKRKADINLNAKCPGSDAGYAGMTPLHLSALILSHAGGSDEDIIDEEDDIFSHAKSIDETKKIHDELDDELLKLLLYLGADPNARDATGSTPLMLAAKAGHIRALDALLDHDADPNISNTIGSTALHFAAGFGHVACINLLVKKGANMNAATLVDETNATVVDEINRELFSITPLVLAVEHGEPGAVEALLRLGADIGRAAHVAALSNELDILKAIIHRKRPDPNIFDSGWGTLLCLAVTAKNMDMVSHLLENPKVATSMANPIGQTPLTIASILGYSKIAEFLVEKGADPNKRDHQGRTPLDYAILSANKGLAKFLCQHTRLGLPLDGVRGHSPLYLACRMPNDVIFNEVNAACKKLQPGEYLKLCELAIHAAIMSNNEGRLATLLNTPGIKATVADDDGWTPLQCARSYGRKEMEAQILGAGATDESSGEMKTPTQWHPDDRHAALSPCIGAEQTPRLRDPKIVEVFAMMGGAIHLLSQSGEEAVARANHCIPDGQDFFFEIKLEKCYKEGDQTLGIGLCSDIAPLNRQLGFGHLVVSCGYHANDGKVYASGMESTGLFKQTKYGEGDIVGCGVDAKNGTIYFTKGGQRLEDAFCRPAGKLYPAVFFGMRETGVRLSLEKMSR